MTDYTAEKLQIRAAGYPYKGAYIAGGALTSVFTGKQINDVDFYFKSRRDFKEAIFQSYEESFWCVATSKRAVTFSDNNRIYQLMYFDFFPTAEDIFKAFDFTACMGAVDLDADELVLHPDFMKHNSQRFLRFNAGRRYPLASATRVLKYQQRGYTIGKGDILKIALACRGVKIETWDDLKDQIGGAYGEKVALSGEEQEFNLENAIASLTVDAEGKDQFIARGTESQPGDAMALLRKLAEINGAEFVPPDLDRDGWPLPLAA
jgi:hypothetical protein